MGWVDDDTWVSHLLGDMGTTLEQHGFDLYGAAGTTDRHYSSGPLMLMRRAAARHDGQVHPDGQRVERVNTDPAQHAAEAGRAYRGLSRASAFSAARVRPEP